MRSYIQITPTAIMGRLREIEFLYLIFVSNHRNIKSAISNENLLNPDIETEKIIHF